MPCRPSLNPADPDQDESSYEMYLVAFIMIAIGGVVFNAEPATVSWLAFLLRRSVAVVL